MASVADMVLDDPESFHLLTADMKLRIIDAAINKVNIQAAMTRKKAITNIQANFTLRNAWTAKQVQFTQMPKGRYSLSVIQASVGITELAPYMERQELGGSFAPLKGGKKFAIPSLVARGGNLGVMVKRPFWTPNLKKLKVKEKLTGGTEKSRQVARAFIAFRDNKLVRYGENLFVVDSFVARGGNVSFKKRMLYQRDKTTINTPARPWFLPVVEAVAREGETIFAREMQKAGL